MDKKILKKINFDLNLAKIYTLISLAFIIWLAAFSYYNFYDSLKNIRLIKQVKRRVAENKVDITGWYNIERNLEWKKQPLADGKLTVNPFK